MSGFFQAGDGPLQRLHPLTKVTLLGCVMMLVLTGPGYWTPTAVFLTLFLLSLWGKIGKVWARQNGRLLLPLLLMLLLIHGFLNPAGQTPLLTVGRLSIYREGVEFAYLLGSRIAAIVGGTLLLLLTTRPTALLSALQERGFPPSLAYVISSTLTLLPQMQRKATAITQAQQARGLVVEGSIFRRIQALLPLVTPLVLGALVESEERAIALEARAFRVPGPKTIRSAPADSRVQRWVRVLLYCCIILLLARQLWLWLMLLI